MKKCMKSKNHLQKKKPRSFSNQSQAYKPNESSHLRQYPYLANLDITPEYKQQKL